MDTKNNETFEKLLNELITQEISDEATELKKELILDLMNKKINYVNVIAYYYDIKILNEKKEAQDN